MMVTTTLCIQWEQGSFRSAYPPSSFGYVGFAMERTGGRNSYRENNTGTNLFWDDIATTM